MLNRQDDRCDKCHAQAFVRVISRESGNDLLFCGHHFGRYEMVLFMAGWIIEDHRRDINAAPSPSGHM